MKVRDRRVAAADEYRTANRRAIYLANLVRGPRPEGARRGPVLPQPVRRGYDVRTTNPRTGLPASGRRRPGSIHRIILHHTGFVAADPVPVTSDPDDFETDDHRLDVVIAHFVVRENGVIVYTHDVETILNGTGAMTDSIEIEFEGEHNSERGPHPRSPRARRTQLQAGRHLVRALVHHPELDIATIHPHQQYSPSTRSNCPGPDIWVNVGEWAGRTLRLGHGTGDRTDTISEHMSNRAYQISGL